MMVWEVVTQQTADLRAFEPPISTDTNLPRWPLADNSLSIYIRGLCFSWRELFPPFASARTATCAEMELTSGITPTRILGGSN